MLMKSIRVAKRPSGSYSIFPNNLPGSFESALGKDKSPGGGSWQAIKHMRNHSQVADYCGEDDSRQVPASSEEAWPPGSRDYFKKPLKNFQVGQGGRGDFGTHQNISKRKRTNHKPLAGWRHCEACRNF